MTSISPDVAKKIADFERSAKRNPANPYWRSALAEAKRDAGITLSADEKALIVKIDEYYRLGRLVDDVSKRQRVLSSQFRLLTAQERDAKMVEVHALRAERAPLENAQYKIGREIGFSDSL